MSTNRIKVLIVDDDLFLVSKIAEELNKRGYKASYLTTAREVQDAIEELSPDVLVFDVEIGEENGIDMAEQLFKGNPTLPIIFISSHHDEDRKTAGLMAGGVAYIDKPFSPKLLSAHIDRFTRMKKLTPEKPEHITTVGNAQLDTRNRTLILANNSIIDLRPMEYVILKKLLDCFDEVVSREDFYLAIWKDDASLYNEQSLNNYIRRIRVILEEGDTGVEVYLHRGYGYRLRKTMKKF